MSRKSTGVAVLVGAAIAVGAVVAFASGKKKTGEVDDEDDDFDDETDEPVSPVLPSSTPPVTPLGTPPFVPPGIINVSNPVPVGPPIAPPPVVPSPTQPLPPVVQLPDDDSEADVPTVNLPGITIPGAVTLPGGVQVPIPPIPGVTAPPAAVPAPPVVAVEQPSLVPADTAALAALMLGEEGTTRWKRKYPELGAWQASRGLVVDQSFGPGSALRMAQEIGTVPIVRFWPRGTLPQTALEPYRNSLLALAGAAPEPRKSQLIMSANREQGQGFGSSTKPVATLVNLNTVPA